MALGDTYAGAPDQQFTADAGGTNPGGFFGNSKPAFGNEMHGWGGTILGTATGGLFGQDLFGGLVEEARNWAESEFPIPFVPGTVTGPSGAVGWQDGRLQMNPSQGTLASMNTQQAGGMGLLSSGFNQLQQSQGDFSNIRDENLGLLRELARNKEDQAAASTASRLFSSGVLGSTGGANQMRALQEAQQQADLQRQLASIGLARDQQQTTFNQALKQIGLSPEMFQGAVRSQAPLFQQADLSARIGEGRANARAAGGQIATQRQSDRRGFAGNLVGDVIGGVGSLFSSDERLKSNIVDRDTGKITKEQADNLRSVDFDMFGERGSGVIAQDLEKVGLGDLVVEHPSGYKMVNYGELTARLLSTLKEVYAHG